MKTFEGDILHESIIDVKTKSNIEVLKTVILNLNSEKKASAIYEKILAINLEGEKGIDGKKIEELRKVDWGANAYLVRGISVYKLSTKIYSKLESDAKISGVAFSTGGEIYSSDSKTSNGYDITLNVIPINTSFVRDTLSEKTHDEIIGLAKKLGLEPKILYNAITTSVIEPLKRGGTVRVIPKSAGAESRTIIVPAEYATASKRVLVEAPRRTTKIVDGKEVINEIPAKYETQYPSDKREEYEKHAVEVYRLLYDKEVIINDSLKLRLDSLIKDIVNKKSPKIKLPKEY